MHNERRLAVLRAIVEDYVSTDEPVGSRALVERHGLGVSPATVRNDMAALEDEGFITQPHTSAGRIPTDRGYRLFVDRLAEVKPLSGAERRAIATFMEGASDLDDVIRRSVRLLSQLTHQVAIVQYPGTPSAGAGDRVAVAGASNLARYGDSFHSVVRPMLEAIEEQVVLLKLIDNVTPGGLVTVRIGAEGPYEELSSTSVVTANYGPTGSPVASLGVVGPTRMDYPSTMAAVRAVAAYVSQILNEV